VQDLQLGISRTKLMLVFLACFFGVFNISALFIQYLSGEAINAHGTIVDVFNGSVLWMASMISLLIAVKRYPNTKRVLLWLVVSAAVGFLAIDEIFEIHEQTKYIIGEDDYVKFAMLLVALAAMVVLYQTERPSKQVVQLICAGLLFHVCYLTVDFGDGDFFVLPIALNNLYWAEEAFEMLGVQTYFAGLLVFYTTQAGEPVPEMSVEIVCGEGAELEL
jgi:hypothetical protein